MKEQMKETKVRADQLKPQIPMRRLGDKEMRQVAGGTIGYPNMGPKKP
jgi:hypothetical protein